VTTAKGSEKERVDARSFLPTPGSDSDDVNLTPKGSGHMVWGKDQVDMGNSHDFDVRHQDS
jgi:hypothetical protein